MFRYRATPLACGKSPAELYLNRPLRIRLNAIFPNKPQPIQTPNRRCRSLQVGERVQVQLYINNKKIWNFGTVKKKLGTRHYLVTLDTGRVLKRHINQIHTSLVLKPQKNVTFGQSHIYEIPRVPTAVQPEAQPLPLQTPPEAAAAAPEPPVQLVQRPQRNRQRPARFRDYV